MPVARLARKPRRCSLDRARASDPDFAAPDTVVADVCARLDGVPLAIELAAARSASLGVDGLLAGLDDHLRLLAGSRGAHERHRSLRAVIDWSHDLLDGDERAMFRRAGAFSGRFDLDAAVAVSPGMYRGMVADLVGRLDRQEPADPPPRPRGQPLADAADHPGLRPGPAGRQRGGGHGPRRAPALGRVRGR